jgi:hypothetical protein
VLEQSQVCPDDEEMGIHGLLCSNNREYNDISTATMKKLKFSIETISGRVYVVRIAMYQSFSSVFTTLIAADNLNQC